MLSNTGAPNLKRSHCMLHVQQLCRPKAERRLHATLRNTDAPGKVLTGGARPWAPPCYTPPTSQVDKVRPSKHAAPLDLLTPGSALSSFLPGGGISEGGNHFPCLAACLESIRWEMVKGGDKGAPAACLVGHSVLQAARFYGGTELCFLDED